jgi:hypothetical protein
LNAASEILRAALEETARELGRSLDGPLEQLGRPFLPTTLPTVAFESPLDAVGGLAWGALPTPQIAAWLARVPRGGVAAQVVARGRPGPRGLLDRVMLRPSRERPVSLEEPCTALFLHGLRWMRVIDLEPRRNLVAILGARTF